MMGRSPYGFLGKTQGLPANGLAANDIADRVLDTLLKQAARNEALSEGLLSALEDSQSFDDANTRIGFVRRVSRWPRHLVAPLKAAGAFNNQVSGDWRVPHGVDDLLSRIA